MNGLRHNFSKQLLEKDNTLLIAPNQYLSQKQPSSFIVMQTLSSLLKLFIHTSALGERIMTLFFFVYNL